MAFPLSRILHSKLVDQVHGNEMVLITGARMGPPFDLVVLFQLAGQLDAETRAALAQQVDKVRKELKAQVWPTHRRRPPPLRRRPQGEAH